MLIDKYSEIGRLFNSNFIGETSSRGKFAYRGDLVLVGDIDVPPNERRPPASLMTQAVLLTNETQILGLFGALEHLQNLDELLSFCAADLAADAVVMVFARDVPKPLVLRRDGRVVHLQPNDDTLIYNELLDVLYLEKGDLKKLSAEDRVLYVCEAANKHKSRAETVDWETALARRVDKKPVERVGAI